MKILLKLKVQRLENYNPLYQNQKVIIYLFIIKTKKKNNIYLTKKINFIGFLKKILQKYSKSLEKNNWKKFNTKF